MEDIDVNYIEIYKMLDENVEQEIQDKGIELACKIGGIEKYILPLYPSYDKNIWENCAKILEQKTDKELEPYLMELLEWLQDLNWPGAFKILSRLKRIDGKMLAKPYTKTFTLILNRDKENQEWGDVLSALIENKSLADELPQTLYLKIKKYIMILGRVEKSKPLTLKMLGRLW